MGYFDIFKDDPKKRTYIKSKGVGSGAVKAQSDKRRQLRDSSGSGSVGKYPKPKRKSRVVLRKRKKEIKSIFDRLKRR